MREILKFKTFRKSIIPIVVIIIASTVLCYNNKYIPYTTGNLIENVVILLVAAFVACLIRDVVEIIRKKDK